MAGYLLYHPLLCQCLLVVILVLCSRTYLVESCSSQEATDLKTYRSPIVVEGEILSSPTNTSAKIKVKRDRKKISNNALKGDRITLIGFGSLNPCVLELSEFNIKKNYMFYIINITETNSEFQLTGNPDPADNKVRKIVEKTVRSGGPPKLTNPVRSKKLEESSEYSTKCTATGNPLPDITWRKDNHTLEHNSISGVRIRKKIKKKSSSSYLRIKKVKESIHEGEYTCVVNNHVDPPILSSARLEICALRCDHGELHVKRCRCNCLDGWEGKSCERRICPSLECGAGGSVDPEECQCLCNEGFGLQNGTCLRFTPAAFVGPCIQDSCYNEGTCIEVQTTDNYSSHTCSCKRGSSGSRCESKICDQECIHGTLEVDIINGCMCRCDANYTGSNCETLLDAHIEACPPDYANFCLNGGTCNYLKGLGEPSCLCPPLYRGSRRCQLHVRKNPDEDASQSDFSIDKDSKKLIICLSIIFGTLLIILGLLLLAYFKNKNARERERQERMERRRENLQMSATTRPTNFSLATVPANSIELKQYRRPSAPHPQRYQSDSDLGTMQGTFHSHSIDGRLGSYCSGSLQRNNQTPNGHARKVSQASMQSTRSNGSLRSASENRKSNSVEQKPANKSGYESVPTEDTDAPRIEVVNEETPLRSVSIEEEPPKVGKNEQEPLSTETESELESNNGDVAGDRVDDLNPQLEALQSHPALKEETEDSVGEYSSDLGYNPYESPVHKSPHRTRNRLQGSNGQARHMGIYTNPMEGAYEQPPTSHAIDIQDENGYYAQRLRDVVENSPPSAV